jgi:hypothetical protein
MTNKRPSFYLGTEIDGVHMSAEQLNVRAQNLNSLIGSISFTEALFHILVGRKPSDDETKLFDIVLVAFHGGFGLLPPTTFVPRIVAGTGVNTAQAMAAGYLASGPYHVGAIEFAMAFYVDVAEEFQKQVPAAEQTAEKLEQFAYDRTDELMEQGEVVGGFGHPLLRKDPRPIHMRRLLCDHKAEGIYLDIYDGTNRCMLDKKGVPPNVDGICGAILLHLGLQPKHGVGLFLLARSAAMLAHIVEEQTDMPYQTMKRFMLTPILTPGIFNSDFKAHAKRFNKLRDSKILKGLKSVFGWRSRKVKRECAQKESTDRGVIDEYRTARAGTGVSQGLIDKGEISKKDPFAETRRVEPGSTDPAEDSDNLIAEIGADIEDCSASEKLEGASFLLASLAEDDSLSAEQQALLASALDLVSKTNPE